MQKQGDHLVALEVVRLGERDAELAGSIDAGQLARTHSPTAARPASVSVYVVRSGRLPSPVDADLGEQPRPLEATDRVVSVPLVIVTRRSSRRCA